MAAGNLGGGRPDASGGDAARLARGSGLAVTLENTSSIDLDVEVESAPAWLRVSPVTLPRSATALLRGRVLEGAPAGPQQIALGVRVRNLHVRPDAQLRATLTLRAVIDR